MLLFVDGPHRLPLAERLLRDVFRIILHHHEWFNGAGVPFQLKGEQIPLESRILCAAEAYDAARAILGEVIAEGDPTQRGEAERLLAQIG